MTDAIEKLDMHVGLREIAQATGAPAELADFVFEALPEGLRNLEVTRDAESRHLYYHLGQLIDGLNGGAVVWASREAPALFRLWRCVVTCLQRLDQRSCALILGQLGHVLRHKEFLEEISIACGVPEGVRLDYEVSLLDGREKSVDWQITPARGPIVLLEAKARSVDLIQHFNQILPQIRAGAQTISGVPAPDASLLFKSIDDKFPARRPGLFLQGAWIVANIKHSEQALLDVFARIDPLKLHFAIIANAERKAYLLKRDGIPADYLRTVLRFEESRDLVIE